MFSLHTILEQHWQNPKPWLRLLLAPWSRLFAWVVMYRKKPIAQNLPIPVVIEGNLHAGGTGKTPIVASLVTQLQQRGIRVGIISRGYGRIQKTAHIVTPHSTAKQAGDEPLLLYRQTQAPLAVAANRAEAAQLLFAHYPQLQLIIADDGLQHYRLARDIEICVFPAIDVLRDDLDVLPNGALREPLSRLNNIDALLISQGNAHLATQAQQRFTPSLPVFYSQIHARPPYRLNNPSQTITPQEIAQHAYCVALAGIARPERFFDSLTQLGFVLNEQYILPDHANLSIETLPHADYLFITEKDAVKLPQSVGDHIWVLPINADIQPNLSDWLMLKLKLSDIQSK